MAQGYGKRGWSGGNPPTVPFGLNTYSPQARGLIAWWPTLGVPSGSVLWNRSGRGVHLAKTGAVNNIGVDTLGRANNWNADAYYSVANAGSLCNLGTQFTIALWTRVAAVDAATRALIHQPSNATGNITYLIRRESAALVLKNIGIADVSRANVFTDTNWKHVVETYDGAYIRNYVNGIIGVPSAGAASVTSPLLTELRIGSKCDNSQYWRGDIGDVRIYNRPLAEAEVWQLYNPATRFDLYAPLQRFWTGAALGSPWYQQLQQRVS